MSYLTGSVQSLLAKQACHRLASGGRPTRHLAYWIGHTTKCPACPGLTPRLSLGSTGTCAVCFWRPSGSCASPSIPWGRSHRQLSTASSPPTLSPTRLRPGTLTSPGESRVGLWTLPAKGADVAISALVEDILHFFTSYPQVEYAWELLYTRVAHCFGGLPLLVRLILLLTWSPLPSALRRTHWSCYRPLHRADMVYPGWALLTHPRGRADSCRFCCCCQPAAFYLQLVSCFSSLRGAILGLALPPGNFCLCRLPPHLSIKSMSSKTGSSFGLHCE